MRSTLDRTTARPPGFVRRTVGAAAGRFAEAVAPTFTPAMAREVGIPGGTYDEAQGTTVSAYNPSLQGPAWFRKVDEMLTACSQAQVLELCWCLPIVSAEWSVTGCRAGTRAKWCGRD